MKERIRYIDTVRSLAMLWIVGYWHLIQYSGEGYIEKYTFLGEVYITMVMLGLFMFLSGYLCGRRKFERKDEIWTFYKKRFWRFYLLYALSALLLYALGFINGKLVLFTTLTALSSFILPQPNTLWFMSMLTFFYLITPLLKKNYVYGGGIFLIIIALHYLIPGGIDNRLFIYYPIYSCGLYLANTNTLEIVMRNKITLPATLLLSMLLFLWLLKGIEWLSFPFIFFGMLLLLTSFRKFEFSFCDRVVNFLAYSSLCAYLYHREIYILIIDVFERIGVNHPIGVCVTIMLPICLVVSYFIQRQYDYALNKLKK